MSLSKRKLDETKPYEEGAQLRKARTEPNLDMPVAGEVTMTTIYNRTSKNSKCCVRMGCRIRPSNTRTLGTVGPIVHAVETDEFHFLTSRHIFGPYQDPKMLIGTKVMLLTSTEDTIGKGNDKICGEVIATKYSDELDVALVKIYKAHLPDRHQFLRVNETKMKVAGFSMASSCSFEIQHLPMEEKELIEHDFETRPLVKLGIESDVSFGKIQLNENKQMTGTYRIHLDAPDYTFMQILTYVDQFLVEPLGSEVFACAEDVGTTVYLVDKRNRFRCFGMISRLMNKSKGVLVTPIQKILKSLGEQVGKTLKIAALNIEDENKTDAELSDPCDIELFNHALQEGHEHDRHIRVNIIGFYGQGKTTLTRRLLQDSLENIESTDGIDIHIRKCIITDDKWKKCETTHECKEFARRLVVVAQTKEVIPQSSERHTEMEHQLDLNTPLTILESPSTSYQSQTIKTRKQSPVKDKELFKEFLNEKEKRQGEEMSEEEGLATIWDFGGQYIYYATHQIFHARDAIYLLVFDLSLDLENIIEDEDFPNRQEKVKNSLMFWVNSINAFVGTEEGTKPKIILVGTHKDKFEGNVNEKFAAVKDLFAGTEARNHIHTQTFAVANVDEDDHTFSELRKTIYEVGKENAARKTVPAKWLPLEMALLCERRRHILKFNDILDMDAANDLPIRDENQIKTFLKHHHEKGILVFFDEEELNQYVIINPQFLTNAFKCIITSKNICVGTKRLYQLWKRMTEKAVLERDLLDAVWNKESCFKKYKEILLMFLQKHRILAEVLRMDEKSGHVRGLSKYMIPSLLKANCSEKTTADFLNNKRYTNVILALSLENSVVLATIYEKVTAAALGKWPPIVFRGQTLVFQNLGFYRLDLQHAGMIAVTDEYLELLVINQCSKEVDSSVCDRFRRYVEMVVAFNFRKLHKDEREKPYHHFFKCLHADHCGKASDAVHDVDDLSKEEEPDVCCPDNYGHMFDAKTAINKWFQRRNIHKTQHKLSAHLSEKEIGKIADAVGMNWEILGTALGVSSVEIDRIKIDSGNSTTILKVFTMLKEWKTANPTNDNLQTLIDAMKDSAVNVDWDKIRNMLDNF